MSGEEWPGEEADHLFALAPEAFTAARDRLARSMRDSGDRGGAAEITRLRRPTVAAWALNQLARRHGAEVTELLDAGEQLREAQREAMAGGGAGPLREAQRRRRTVVTELTDLAAAALREAGTEPEAHVPAVRRALEAASIDEDAAAALRRGRMSRPPEPDTALGGFEGLFAAPDTGEVLGDTVPPPTAIEDEADDTREEVRRAATERAAARLKAAERAADAAAAAADARRREAEVADEAAADAAADVERLSEELEQARDRARRSAEQARLATRSAEEAEAAAARHERERRDAREDLDQLRRP